MPTTYIAPMDYKTIFVNYFLGTTELFIYAFVILISFLCARFGVSNKVYFSVLIIGSLIMAGFLGQSIYVLIIFIIGLITYKGIGAVMQ